ncbi:uridine kinase [Ureibacillus manganicus DSM 26584]|uniref:Uridine kinase n=1 Tax=Ureibacillus manganicus DSM 26584 TaxID=1384049 RepID=A0A0A3I1M0_9BACL|nr:uridine kinase [Ureibacillus manganicus DSM 26584]
MTRSDKNRPYIVAIDGLSGAGKTTLVNKIESELKQKINVVLIHIDDHIVERNRRYDTGYEEWYEYYYLQWNVQYLKEVLFEKLYNNSKILSLPFYDKTRDTTNHRSISLSPQTIVIIEGIFLQRKEWKTFYDYTIFIDCPREVRYTRVLERDKYIGDEQAILNKYNRRYWPGEVHYIETENPMKLADTIYHTIY